MGLTKTDLEREIMQLKRNQLRDAITFALCVGATSLVGTGLAMAQDATAPQEAPAATQEATTLDRIEVTGSRISIPGLTTNSPVMTVERDEIDRAQSVSAEDFIKLIPAATPAIGPGTNNGANGGATVDLRGLGSNRTLVLMDGRRIVPFNLAGVVDTNVIPVALIQSVDLVTGGASAVYGADAVAGVVNFVLKRNFEGVEIDTSYGQSSRGDAARMNTSITMGANLDDGRGNVVLSVGKTDNDPLLQGDREFSEFNLNSNSGNPGGSAASLPTAIDGILLDGAPDFAQIDPATGEFVPFYQTFNYNPYNYHQTSLDRWQATALGRYEITENAEAYAQLLYTRSNVFSQIAPGGIFGNSFDFTVGNPLIPDIARQQMCDAHNDAIANGAPGALIANCTLGSAEVANLSTYRRTTELGTRYTDFQNKVFQTTLGVRGNLTDTWRYDAYWSHGEADQLTNQGGFLGQSKVQQALLTDGVNCQDTSNGCIPLDLWGPEGSISPDSKTFLEVVTFAKQQVQQDVWSGSVNGDLGDNFKSPWADYPIGLAFGLEGRKTEALNMADAASKDPAEVMGSGGANPDIFGEFSLNEVYGEALVPLVSDKPGMYAVNVELGYRHSKFESGGNSENYGSYKYGLEWAPIESLRFRGMFQRATRAPNVNELFSPQSTVLDNVSTDPCQGAFINAADAAVAGTLSNLCVQTGVPIGRVGTVAEPNSGQANVFTGGNPLVGPEEADTQTIGVVWQPSEDLAVTLDFWKIEINDTIDSATIADVLNDCYDAERNPTFTLNASCQLIVGGRHPVNGGLSGSAGEVRGAFLPITNSGTTMTQGWDLGVRYGFDLAPEWGRLDFAVDTTMLNTFENKASDISLNRQCVGYYSSACNTVAGQVYDWKSNARAIWSKGDYEVGLNWRHLSAIKVEPLSTDPADPWFPAFTNIPDYNYFDLSFAMNLPWNARLNLTINNVADKDPPIVGGNMGSTSVNSGNTFPQYYDTLGRYYTVGLNWKF